VFLKLMLNFFISLVLSNLTFVKVAVKVADEVVACKAKGIGKGKELLQRIWNRSYPRLSRYAVYNRACQICILYPIVR